MTGRDDIKLIKNQKADDVKYTMYVGIARMVVFRLGSALLSGFILDRGVIGVWTAMRMDWLARSACFAAR